MESLASLGAGGMIGIAVLIAPFMLIELWDHIRKNGKCECRKCQRRIFGR